MEHTENDRYSGEGGDVSGRNKLGQILMRMLEVIVLGHSEFYPRFGFSAKLAEPLGSPYSEPAFTAVELVPEALQGVEGEIRYPPPFQDL